MAASSSMSGLPKDRNLPGTSASSGGLTLGSNVAERKNSTKTILEDVCMDFESMDVISPAKANKAGVVKNVRNVGKPDQSPKEVAEGAKISDTGDKKAARDVSSSLSSNTQVRIIEPSEVELTANQMALVSEFVSANSGDPSCDAQDVIDLPEGAVKNLASLAQLADAEIVQTGDNVSIIVTNPRLIEVLTNPDSSASSAAAYLDAGLAGAQPLNVVGQTLLDENIFQTMDIANVVQETVITEEGHEISSSSKSKARTIYGTLKGKTNKSLFKPVYSPPASTLKARRVTAKMKAEWARQIKRNGHVTCQMPGCSQNYITVANFTTHYKYCTGKESLQLCLYCKSLIFSSHKAMLQHMEVEHPDKVEQFKAAYPFEDLESEESSNKDSSMMLEEDDVALNIAEVSQKNAKKCKLSSKENIVLPKRTILKHKLQSIQNSMAENAKEFKKCVKFDNIVDKINSVEDLCKIESIPSSKSPRPKEKRRRVVLTESIVAEKKYFEDDEDDPGAEPKDEPVEDPGEEVHTKARMVLNKERYKRYKEYLKLTRDWSSERRTYSRGRGSDVSSDSSFLLNSMNESVEDVHQLSRTAREAESSSISLNATETELEMSSLPALESENLVSLTEASDKLIDSLISLANKTADNPDNKNALADKKSNDPIVPLSDKTGDRPPALLNETVAKEPQNVVERNFTPDAKIRRPCYSRASQEVPPKPKPRYQAIITYGVNVPARASKPEEEPITFDSLVNSMKADSVRKNSQSVVVEAVTEVESAPQLEKSEGKIETAAAPKRKRGRPPKPKPESPAEVKKGAKNKIEDIKNAKKYSTAMLKSIEKNVRNRKIRLFGIKKNSKFKAKSKMYLQQSLSKQASLKNKKSKLSKRTLIAKNIIKRRSAKAKSIDKSAIQCQENIDNHLILENEAVVSHIQCLPSDHSYMNSEVVEGHSVIDANNIVGEVEITTSNADNVPQPVVEDNQAESIRSDLINEVSAATPQSISNVPAEEIPEVSNIQPENSASLQSANTEKEVEGDGLDQNNKKPSDSLEEQQNDIAMVQTTASIVHDATVIPETQPRKDEALSSNEPPSLEEAQRVCDKELSSQQDTDKGEKISSNEQLENVLASQKDIEAASEVAAVSNSEHSQLNVKEVAPLLDASSIAVHSDSLMVCDDKSGAAENTDSAMEISATVESTSSLQVQPELQVHPEQEVVVKRRRGRPKKNSIPLPVMDVSNFASPLESTPIVHADKSKMESFKEGQVTIETSGLMTDDSNGTPNLRKSERVRRRKLVTENLFEASPIEIKAPKEEVVTVRTGRRGRPRKYSAKEMGADLSEGKTEEAAGLGTSQAETEPSVEGRKLSRKSRPRKCVRYADLNTGVDSSESLDGLSGASAGKDKPESPKLKGRGAAAQKPSNETDLGGKKKAVECEGATSNDQDGKIVLPLKKRKQRQTKKDDSVIESVAAAKNNEEPEEVLLSNEEEENDLDAESKTPKRVRKGSKRKQCDRESDTSDEDWDISNYLNRTRPSSRKRHQKVSAQELLELEEESSDDSYSSGRDSPSVKSKKGSKKLHETSGHRRTSIRSFSRARHLEMMIASKQHPKDNILQKYKPKKSMWTQLCDEDYDAALPSLKKSVFFKIENTWESKKESFWNSLDFFDSVPVDKESSHCTFFTGGPVLCSAWCPTPTDVEAQYIALASSFSTNKLNSYVCTQVEKCLIQLWNVGVLKEKTVLSKPSMELGIFLEWGPVTDMVWCPDGCWEDPSPLACDDLPRLGLLALACADGNVRIYSVPHPRCLPREAPLPLFSASPSVLLEPMHGEVCAVTRRSMCVSVCWQKSDSFGHIAAGYGNGMICLWRINHSSMILAVEKDNQIRFNPYLVFNAHGTPVYGISFASLPGNRFLVSSSIDRTLKFWDLIDTSVPFFSVKKGAGKGVEWASHYCGAFGALEHGMNCFKGCSFFKECGTEKFQSRTLSGVSCGLMKSTLSEWLNAVALADMAGTVSVSFIYSLLQEHPKSPLFLQRPVYKSELQLVDGIVEKMAFSSHYETESVASSLREISEVTGVMHNLIETCCEDASDSETMKEVSSNRQNSSPEDYNEKSGSAKCLTEVVEMADIVSTVHRLLDRLGDDEGDNVTEGGQLLSAQTQTEVSHKGDSNGECNGLDQTENEQHLVAETGSSFDLAEITDIVSTLVDVQDTADIVNDMGDVVTSLTTIKEVVDSVDHLKDVTSIMDKLKDLIEICSAKDILVPLRIGARHLVGKLPSLTDIDESTIKDLSRLVSKELADVGDPIAYKEEVHNLCNLLLSVTKELKDEEDRTAASSSLVVDDQMESDGLEQTETKQHLVSGTGLPFDLAEITDVVSTLVDVQDTADIVNDVEDVVTSLTTIKEVVDSVDHLRDVTSIMDKLKDLIEIGSAKDILVPLKIGARHLVGKLPCLTNIDESIIKDLGRLVSKEPADICDPVAYKDEVRNLCNLLLIVTKELKDEEVRTTAEEMESNGLEQMETEQHLLGASSSSFGLAEITDIVSTPLVDIQDTADIVNNVEDVLTSMTTMKEVIDSVDHLRDITSVMDKLKDLIEVHSAKDLVVPLRLMARHFVAQLPFTADYDLSPIRDLSHVETENVRDPVAYKEEVRNLCNLLLSVTKELNDKEDRTASCTSLVDADELFNESKVSDMQNLDTPLENENRISPSVHEELNPVTASAESCIVCKAELCHCPPTAASQNLIDNFSVLPDEEMDEPMLSGEEDSSGSDNDMDSEDDLEASNSFLFDQDSNFSGDSVLSECSLDSNISMCSSSGDSDISEASSGSTPGDQMDPDIEQNFSDFQNLPPESHPNDPVAVVKESPSVSDCAVAADIVNLESHSIAEVVQEIQVVESMDADSPSDLVVSIPDGSDTSVENGVESLCDKIHENDNSDSPEALNVSESVEIVSELPSGENDLVSGQPLEETGSAVSDEMTQQIEKLHDADYVCVEVVDKVICVSSELSEQTDCNNANNTLSENNLEKCESLCVGPETVEIVESAVSTMDNICDEEMNSAVDNAVINSERRNLLLTKSFLSYEDIVSEYGIVFKDMNTAQFESIEEDKKSEEVNSSLDHYQLTSIKALSWNPNFGSHSWLFSAGLSGLARLSYVSDVNRPNERTEANDA